LCGEDSIWLQPTSQVDQNHYTAFARVLARSRFIWLAVLYDSKHCPFRFPLSFVFAAVVAAASDRGDARPWGGK
jgi:hypothetical protein